MIKHDDEWDKSIVQGDENQALSHLEIYFTARNGSDSEVSDCCGMAGTARALKACPEMAIETMIALLDAGTLREAALHRNGYEEDYSSMAATLRKRLAPGGGYGDGANRPPGPLRR